MGQEKVVWLVDYGIIGILALLSVLVVAVAIERALFYRRTKVNAFGSVKKLERVLTARLHWLATTASNAPYIGLLGTILGVMLTFYKMGLDANIGTSQIMLGLALALKATAVGLLVALIATVLYNFLVRKVNVIIMQWEEEHEVTHH